jgi:hypothetical protein
MPTIDRHAPGSLCWFELAALNQAAAKSFYQSLFGWEVADSPIGANDYYSTFRLSGRDVAAAYTMREEQRNAGTPPNWMVYVLVDDADLTARRAAELHGTVLAAPFDVMNHGRMSVLRDPAGAIVSLWQPKQHQGTGLTGEPGTAVWADLSTPDQAKSAQFYERLFGWTMVEGKSMIAAKPGSYYHIVNRGEFMGGIPPADHRAPNTPAHWLVYFGVADCDAAAAKATALGGKVLHGPMAMENVRSFAVLADPEGAAFGIVEAK